MTKPHKVTTLVIIAYTPINAYLLFEGLGGLDLCLSRGLWAVPAGIIAAVIAGFGFACAFAFLGAGIAVAIHHFFLEDKLGEKYQDVVGLVGVCSVNLIVILLDLLGFISWFR